MATAKYFLTAGNFCGRGKAQGFMILGATHQPGPPRCRKISSCRIEPVRSSVAVSRGRWRPNRMLGQFGILRVAWDVKADGVRPGVFRVGGRARVLVWFSDCDGLWRADAVHRAPALPSSFSLLTVPCAVGGVDGAGGLGSRRAGSYAGTERWSRCAYVPLAALLSSPVPRSGARESPAVSPH